MRRRSSKKSRVKLPIILSIITLAVGIAGLVSTNFWSYVSHFKQEATSDSRPIVIIAAETGGVAAGRDVHNGLDESTIERIVENAISKLKEHQTASREKSEPKTVASSGETEQPVSASATGGVSTAIATALNAPTVSGAAFTKPSYLQSLPVTSNSVLGSGIQLASLSASDLAKPSYLSGDQFLAAALGRTNNALFTAQSTSLIGSDLGKPSYLTGVQFPSSSLAVTASSVFGGGVQIASLSASNLAKPSYLSGDQFLAAALGRTSNALFTAQSTSLTGSDFGKPSYLSGAQLPSASTTGVGNPMFGSGATPSSLIGNGILNPLQTSPSQIIGIPRPL
jgi:hypothetical protein